MNKFPPCFTDLDICVLLIFISVPVPFAIDFSNLFICLLEASFHHFLFDLNVLMEIYFLLQKPLLTSVNPSNLLCIQYKLPFYFSHYINPPFLSNCASLS